MIKRLHHNAYRCRDTEITRAFYEDFLGLPLAAALDIDVAANEQPVHVLHSFFEMGDGSYLAFFEVPELPFAFKRQHDFDLHIALLVEPDALDRMIEKAKAQGRELRGPADHGFARSIYLRDPDGYVVELTSETGRQRDMLDPAVSRPHDVLARWRGKRAAARVQSGDLSKT